MLRHKKLRSLPIGLLLSSCLLALPGCGSSAPVYDPKLEYTPETLAQELAFRYERMSPISKPKPIPSLKNREPEGTREKVETKSKETTKAEQAVTLEDLVDETVAKSWRVAGMKPEEALRKVADLIEKNDKIKPTDRRLMAERLTQSK